MQKLWQQIEFTTKYCMFSYKFYPNPENYTPSRMVWMVTSLSPMRIVAPILFFHLALPQGLITFYSLLLSASGERFCVSRMQDFCNIKLLFEDLLAFSSTYKVVFSLYLAVTQNKNIEWKGDLWKPGKSIFIFLFFYLSDIDFCNCLHS